MNWIWIRPNRSVILCSLILAACTQDPQGDEAEGSTGSDDLGDSDTTATTGGSDSESGEPPVECPPRDESVSAAFTITIDGNPIEIDYSEFHSPAADIPETWTRDDMLPEIDDACEVVEQSPGRLSLTCPDTQGVSRELIIELSASEPLSTDVGPGPVHAWYMYNYVGDMLEGLPDTDAHAFVVSNDQGIVLAGIDGRYSLQSSLPVAWPDWPDASIMGEPCPGTGRAPAHVALEDGSSIETYDGSASDLGPFRLLVELAMAEVQIDGGEPQDIDEARWLLGLPG